MTTTAATTARIEAALAEAAARLRSSVAEVKSGGHGHGAGTVWRREGTIVTNHHVVAGERAEVVLADGRAFPATVSARDIQNDLAVLSIPATGLPAVTVGDARAARPGELVLAIGHPFGVRGALAVGVVGHAHQAPGEGRERELVVADLPLRPGNSGGPLADALGRVLGINAMVAGGLALAVPSHLVERLLGGTERPRLGLQVQDATLAPAQAASVPGRPADGVLVISLRAGGPEAAAGVMVGDVLLAVDGRPVPTGEALAAALAGAEGALGLTLLRGAALLDIAVPAPPAARRAA